VKFGTGLTGGKVTAVYGRDLPYHPYDFKVVCTGLEMITDLTVAEP